MTFGKGFHYQEEVKKIPAGVYDATITNIEEATLKGWLALQVHIEVDKFKGYVPNVYTMFAPEDAPDEKMRESCVRRMSRFMDATGAMLGANGLEYQTAIGKRVKVVIGIDNKGFTNITRLLKPTAKAEEQPPF